MGVKSEAIVSLDPVFVDNSQTSKRFETICHVLSETPTPFHRIDSPRLMV